MNGAILAPRPSSLPRVWSWLAAVVIGVAALVLLCRTTAATTPSGDAAVLELYTAFTTEGVWLLGPYSRFGWHHPGPALFYAMAPLYALSGSNGIALNASMLLVNVGAIVALSVVLARGLSGWAAAATLAVIGLFVLRVAPLLTSVWNPHVLVLPLMAALVLSASAASGRLSALPAALAAASFVAQAHVALVPCIATVAALAVLGAAWYRRGVAATSTPVRRVMSSWGWWALACMTLLVFWLPVLIEQVTGNPGNLTQLVRFFAAEEELRLPPATAFSAWAEALAAPLLPGLRLPAGGRVLPTAGLLVTGLAVGQTTILAVAMIRAGRSGRPFLAALNAIGLGALLMGLWSLTRVRGDLVDQATFWLSAVSAVNIGAILAAAIDAFAPVATTETRARVATAAAVAVVAMAAVLGLRQLTTQRRAANDQVLVRSSVDRLVRDVRRALDRACIERPLIRLRGENWEEAAGLVLQLVKAGVPVAVGERSIFMFGPTLAATGREDGELLIVDLDSRSPPRGATVVSERATFVTAYLVSDSRCAG